MKFGNDLQDFSGVLQHPNGDLLQVTKGVLVRQISPGDADYDSLQTGFLSTQDEFAVTIRSDGTMVNGPFAPLRGSNEREVTRTPEMGSGAASSNQDIGGPNFQTSLGGGGVLHDPYRSSGQRMVNSESAEGVMGSAQQAMLDELARQEGRPTRQEEPTQVRNTRTTSYRQPEYEFDTSLTDQMEAALKLENQERYLREGHE